MNDKESEAYLAIWGGYLELVRRRLGFAAMVGGFYGTELPERQLREVLADVCEQLRREMKLNDTWHAYLKDRLFKQVFGATKPTFVISKEFKSNGHS
jgi:hypothetical protein